MIQLKSIEHDYVRILKSQYYRSGTLNSNKVNSKFHLIRSFLEIFARFNHFMFKING